MRNKLTCLLVAVSGGLAIVTLFLPIETPNLKNATGFAWLIWLIPFVSLAGLSGIFDLNAGEFIMGIFYLSIEILGIVNLFYPIFYLIFKKARKPLGSRYFCCLMGANVVLAFVIQFIAGPIHTLGYFSYLLSILLLFTASLLDGFKYIEREGVPHL